MAPAETEGLLPCSSSLESEPSKPQLGQAGPNRAASRALQTSHFLSAWGQRGWEFAVGLIMLELRPSSLLLVALWGLLDSALSVVCGAAVGRYVDSRPRLQAASRMYLLQNSMVAVSAAAALALLLSGVRSGPAFWGGLALTMGAGAISTLGALGATLSVEREWTRALCRADSSALASLNAAMKRIDLACLIASPILVGIVMQYGGKQPSAAAALALLAWNLSSWAPEVLLLRHAQRCSPALAADKQLDHHLTLDGSSAAGSAIGSSDTCWRYVARSMRHQVQAWLLYARQPAAPAALALALLYLTVMSWGTLMTAFIKALGLPEAELALCRGLGALTGILATVTFPPLRRTLGLVATGALSIWLELACLLAAALPSAAATLFHAGISSRARIYSLVSGLVLSRFGLWSFDLAANQLIQESADPHALGAVMGVQGSMQSLCQMLAYLAGVLAPAPDQFVYLMLGSCAVVGAAAAIVTGFALRTQCGRTLHQPVQVT